jgi:hypothetical protein
MIQCTHRQFFHDYPVTPVPRYALASLSLYPATPRIVPHYPALLLCLSLPRPVLLDQLLRPRPDSFVLIFEGQDQRIDRSRGR